MLTKRNKSSVILQVLPSLVSGGVERGAVDLTRGLVKYGHHALVISKGGPLVSDIIESGGIHIQLNVASKNPLIILYNALAISRIIKKYKVDILHARSRAPAWSCYMAAKFCGIPFITTFHGIYKTQNIFKSLYNRIMTYGKRVIAVSNFVQKHILSNYKIDARKVVVINRGVDVDYFNPDKVSEEMIEQYRQKYEVPQDIPPVILLPSRIAKWKGHEILLDALIKIRHSDFYCICVGDTSSHLDLVAYLKNKIIITGMANKIKIFGPEKDMLGLYAISDIVLSTSIEPEAFGRTITEGQVMKKIVIATNIGGATETIIDYMTGLHAEPNNVSNLAQKINYALSIHKTEQNKIIGERARESIIKNYSLDQMINKTLEVYETVL